MSVGPFTVKIRAGTTPRFGVGCAACRAIAPTTAFRLFDESTMSLGSDAVPYFCLCVVGMSTAGSTLSAVFIALVVLANTVPWLALFVMRERRRLATALPVPLCRRCSAEIRLRRISYRAMHGIATCYLITFIIFRRRLPLSVLATALVALAMAGSAWIIWVAMLRPSRINFWRGASAARFEFADAESARRFAAENGS